MASPFSLERVDCFVCLPQASCHVQPIPIAITERLLSGAGGWEAMKAARELWKAGCVSAATYEPPLLAGQVREGQKTYRAGLRIRSASDIENICTCRESREWGKICAHSVAVGLAYLAPAVAPQSIPPSDRPRAAASPLRLAGTNQGQRRLRSISSCRQIFAPPGRKARSWFAWRRSSRDAASCSTRSRVSSGSGATTRDLAVVEYLSGSLGRAAAGMNMLGRVRFSRPLADFARTSATEFRQGECRRGSRRKFTGPRSFFVAPVTDLRSSRKPARMKCSSSPGQMPGSCAALTFSRSEVNLPLRLTNTLREPVRIKSERADEFFALELPLWREVAELELPAGVSLPHRGGRSAVVLPKGGRFVAATACGASLPLR